MITLCMTLHSTTLGKRILLLKRGKSILIMTSKSSEAPKSKKLRIASTLSTRDVR